MPDTTSQLEYTPQEIAEAQSQLNLQHPDSPWWDTPAGQDQCRLIRDCGLKRRGGITVVPKDGAFEARSGDLIAQGWTRAEARAALDRLIKQQAGHVDGELRRRLAAELEQRAAGASTPLAKLVAALEVPTLKAMQRSLNARLTLDYWADHPDLAMAAQMQLTAIGAELIVRDLQQKAAH